MKSRFVVFLTSVAIFMMCAATLPAQQATKRGRHFQLPQRVAQHFSSSRNGISTPAKDGRSRHPRYLNPAAEANRTFLDQSFGTNGKVFTDFGDNAGINAIALQSDGKIVAGGYFAGDVFALARYDTTGLLDPTFGTGGMVTTAIGSNASIYGVAIQPDGKIVAAGYANIGGPANVAVARYKTDGSLDSSFGTNGITTTLVTTGDMAYGVTLQSNGKIIVAGSTGTNRFLVARYTADGTLDATFGSGGSVTTAIETYSGGAAVALQSDTAIVVAGYARSGHYVFAIARYDTTGNVLATNTVDFGADCQAEALALQNDDKIVAAGYVEGSHDRFALARFNADGTIDSTYGSNGQVITAIGPSSSDAFALTIQSDNKAIAAGSTNDVDISKNVIALVRYSPTGVPDSTFGTNGIVVTNLRSNGDGGDAACAQTDGKVIAAGYSGGSSYSDFAMVRYATYPVGITVSAANNFANGGVTLNGVVNAVGVSTTVRFLYGTSPGHYTDSVAAVQSPIAADTGVPVSGGIAGLTSGQTYYYTVSTASSKGYYRGEEKSFTFYNNAGKGLKLSSHFGDYVDIPHFAALDSFQALTIEMWFKWTPSGCADVMFLCASIYESFEIHTGGGSGCYGIRFIPTGGVYLDTRQYMYTQGEWVHLACVYDPANSLGKVYINGVDAGAVNDGSNPMTTPLSSSNADFYIGNRQSMSFPFDGSIDEVQLWNVARDSNQIRLDMHRALSGSETGLLGYWQFNEGTGTTAHDVTSGAHDGMLYNFAFDPSDGWITSTAPFGLGTSDSTTDFSTGTAALGTVSLTTTDDFDNPVGLFSTQIDASPDSLPTSSPTMLSDRYWVINAFGTPGTFSTNLTFTVPSSFTNNGSASMSSFTLYRRSSTSAGDWTMLINGASAMTSTTLTFDGITSFSQFSLGQGALLPIQIAAFTANVAANGVKLDWTTVSETNNFGFYVERHRQDSTAFRTVSGMIPGAGTSLSQHHYSWTDSTAATGDYVYRLRQVDLNGAVSHSQPITVNVVLGVNDEVAPKKFQLLQNYPNPFNPSATIKFSVEHAEHATLIVYDMLGQEVARLFDGAAEPGHYYRLTFDGSRVGSGLYMYRIVTDSHTDVKKMLMIK